MTKKTLRRFAISGTLAVLILGFLIYELVVIDTGCIDRGGRWNYQDWSCEGLEQMIWRGD